MSLILAVIICSQRRGALALSGLLLCTPVPTWGQTAQLLRVESSAEGEIELDARRATITQVLNALAAEAGFEVAIDNAGVRPLVNATVRMEPIDYVLRQILRGRNHALVYDGAEVSHVILLAPSDPRKTSRSRVSRRPRPRKAPTRGPIVVSR